MKYCDFYFRDICYSFVRIKDKNALAQLKEIMVVPDRCDSVFAYCYIDQDAGITFEILHPAVYGKKEIVARESLSMSIKVRAEDYRKSNPVLDIFLDGKSLLSPLFIDYIDSINREYRADDDVEEARTLFQWDSLRARDFPDYIRALLYKDEFQPEQVWVKSKKAVDGHIHGVLVNEPDHNYGVHVGDEVVILPYRSYDELIGLIQLHNSPASEDRYIVGMYFKLQDMRASVHW